MQRLDIGGYTRQQVIDVLHAKYQPRQVKFRYDLLDKNEQFKKSLDKVKSCEINMNYENEIKRTAKFIIEDDGTINWLSDRIQPFFMLKIPEIKNIKRTWYDVKPTFSRSSIAYKSDGTKVTANTPRYEQGAFYPTIATDRAIMIEEGTTNLITNPRAATDLTAIATYTNAGTISIQRVTSLPAGLNLGTGVYVTISNGGTGDNNVIFQGTSGAEAISGITVSPNTTYTFSFWVYNTGDGIPKISLRVIEWNSSGSIVKDNGLTTSTTTFNQWVRLTTTLTTQSTTAKVTLRVTTSAYIGHYYVTGAQLEQKPYATSFIDGTRAAETLTIPTAGVLNPQEGTVECWVYLNGDIATSTPVSTHWIFSHATSGVSPWLNALGFRRDGGVANQWEAWTHDGNGNQTNLIVTWIPTIGWHYFAMRWSASELALFIDGVKIGYASNPYLPAALASVAYVGSWLGSAYFVDTLIDDLRISNRARTDTEIAQAYASGQPLPVDKDTTCKMVCSDTGIKGLYYKDTINIIPSSWVEWPLGIFLLSSPKRQEQNLKVNREVEAYDGLQILKDDKFDYRLYLAAGTNYIQNVANILNSAGITKMNLQACADTLGVDREWDPGTNKLTVINQLLKDINYTDIWVDENGYFTTSKYMTPAQRAAEYTYKDDDLSILYPGVEEDLDLFAVPNKWTIVASNTDTAPLTSTYTNDNPSSPTSTVNRGRTILDYQTIDYVSSQAALDDFVRKVAFEASQVYGTILFETALMPMHSFNDVLQLIYSPLAINDKYQEIGWSMVLKAGEHMRHEVRKVVQV